MKTTKRREHMRAFSKALSAVRTALVALVGLSAVRTALVALSAVRTALVALSAVRTALVALSASALLIASSNCSSDPSSPPPPGGSGDGSMETAAPTTPTTPAAPAPPPGTPPNPAFGKGAATGTFANDVWTPGVDSNGTVNQVSYDITPSKRWFRIENTRLDGLESELKATIPGWRGYGGAGPTGSSWDGLTISWSGWAVDSEGARAWLFGGGHNNSSNNGIYRFDFFKMKWSIDSLPTDPSTLPADYKNGSSYSTYYPALDATIQKRDQGNLAAINDVWFDELPDGKPTSRHTYRGFTYAKSLNKLVLMCRRLWTYDLAQKKWDFKRLVNDYISQQGTRSQAGAFANDQVISLEGGVSTWDDKARRLVHSAHGSSGNSRQALYDFSLGAQGAWLHEPYVPFYGVGHANAFMGTRKVLYFRIPQDTSRGGYGSPGEYDVRDLDQASVSGTDGKPTYASTAAGTAVWKDGTDPTKLLNPSSGEDDNPALVYIPSIQRFWFFAQLQAGGYQLAELDPTTSPAWSMRKLDLPGDKPTFSGGAGLVGTKMTYIPAFDAVFLQDAASRNLYIYRVR